MKLEYPDEVVFVFNPLYISLECPMYGGYYRINLVKFSISTQNSGYGTKKEIDVRLLLGKSRIYMSRIMELFFTDVRFERSKTLYANISVNGKVVWSVPFICIWGNIAVGERFSQYGAFALDKNKPYCYRKRRWFKNFPFTVSMFAHCWGSKDRDVQARYDGGLYDSSLRIHYPPIWGEIYSIEDEEVQGLAPGPYDGNNLEGAVFDNQEQVFYGSTDDMCLYEDWTPGQYVPGPEEYNINGKARTDKVWTRQNGRLVRYDATLQCLVDMSYGRDGQVGIYEINPAIGFSNAKHSVTFKQKGNQTEAKFSTFDNTFDYTFFMSGEMSTITELEIDESTAGHYLRWIDRFGMFQYFLFVKGKETLKNKLSSNTVVEDYAVGGLYFANHQRNINVEGTRTVKCSAVSLPQEIFDYVSSIETSPIIDLYVGKSKSGEEMWVPVNIVAASHEYNPKQVLHDIEISFTLPPYNAQTI